MKNRLCYILAAMLVLAACSKEGRGRRGGGSDPSYAELELTENLDVTISYTGRGYSTGNSGTLVTDNFHIRTGTQGSYFLDAVPATELRTAYGGQMSRFAKYSQDRLSKELDEGKAQLSKVILQGERDYSTYRLDGGDTDWYIVAFGCDDQGVFNGSYARLFFTTEEVSAHKTDQWQVERGSRTFITENRQQIEVEQFNIITSSPSSYCFSIIDAAEFQRLYAGKVMDFFNAELDAISKTLPESEETFASVLMTGTDTALPNRLWSGNYIFFTYGVDLYGYLTGEYSEYRFSIEEEAATPEFARWLGNWKASGIGNIYDNEGYVTGKKTITYDLTVESAENNLFYAIKGWETGPDADPEIVRYTYNYWLGAPFNPSDGSMIFTTYEMETYDSNRDGNTYVTTLLGNYVYDNKMDAAYGVYDIAKATLRDDSHGTIAGLPLDINVGDNNVITTELVSMQYYDMRIDPSTGDYVVDENGALIMGPLELSIPLFVYNEIDNRGNIKTSTPLTLEKVQGSGDNPAPRAQFKAPQRRSTAGRSSVQTKAQQEESALPGVDRAKRREAAKTIRPQTKASAEGPSRAHAESRVRWTVSR